jgi:hypothetical protein
VDENYDQSEERTEEATDGSEVKVWGNLVAFVERLDDEMFKSLQVIRDGRHRRGVTCAQDFLVMQGLVLSVRLFEWCCHTCLPSGH